MNELKSVSWMNVTLAEGFLGKRQQIISSQTVQAVYERFKETGRIDAMRLQWRDGMPGKPHIFWDSDVAKWLEGASYLLHINPDPDLESKCERIIDSIECGADIDGYFNTYFQTMEPYKRFTNRDLHELYCAGHLMEAAVAYHQATGRDRFLMLMCKYADHIEKVFKVDRSASYKTCGHEEIELALVKMWQAIGERRYIDLAKHFVDSRGTDKSEQVFDWFDPTYAQDNVPVRQLEHAAGHAVRAMYLYSAMADVAREYKDDALYDACRRLWHDTARRKMYITGSLGAERHGEAFGPDFMLPNAEAYAETCASIGMIFFASRMLLIETDSEYADIMERQLYNGALAGISLDGTSFFYENPLEARPRKSHFQDSIHSRYKLPLFRRQRVFDCSCCPPNILRLIASVGGLMYTASEDAIYTHLYGAGDAVIEILGGKINLTQKTEYPWSGDVAITLGMSESQAFTLALRLPGWCKNISVYLNGTCFISAGQAANDISIRNGYAYITKVWQDNDEIIINMPMPVVEMEAHPAVAENSGKIALMRGPLVYCLEETDNPGNIFDILLPQNAVYETSDMVIESCHMKTIKGIAFLRKTAKFENSLYVPYTPDLEEATFTAIPYFAWANRDEGDMLVWIRKQI